MIRLATLLVSLLVTSTPAFAGLAEDFKKLDGQRKGPFSLNYLQGSRGRVVVTDGSASGTFQFQAAFRNELARSIAQQHDLYVGNLFTTNYYELMGEYVYGDAYGSHELDHQALVNAAPQAMPKACSMVRSWVLEKHHLATVPNSALHKGFRLRGISGSEFELAYAGHFFSFYLSSMSDESQFLPAYLLAKGSPLTDSASLEKARTMIAAEYDSFKLMYGESEPAVRRMYSLRNAIHNQLSQAVIGQIDAYLRDFPFYRQYGYTALTEIQGILRAYYSVSPARVAELAKKAGAADIQTLATAIAKKGLTTADVLGLSTMAADLRTRISTSGVISYEKKTANLALLLTLSQYLNKEINSMKNISSSAIIVSLLNLVYAEGFLIADNWQYFVSEAQATADARTAAAILPDVVEISHDTLLQAFNPSYDKWLSVEPKMASFVDNTIKASSLNTASTILDRIK